jgi:large subunit ribosomal protein L7/L12
MATDQEKLLETIGNMTVLELSEFVDAFKEKFNVTAVVAPVAMAGADQASAEVAEEKDEFDVILEGVGGKKNSSHQGSPRGNNTRLERGQGAS